MPALDHASTLLYFAHVPKTGGTSVEEYLIANYGAIELYDRGWQEARLRGERKGRSYPCSDQHLVWEDARRCLSRRPDAVFGIVRDPVARIVSEYLFQIRFRPRVRWLTRLGFSTWLAVMLSTARRTPYFCDNHIRPQGDFLPQEAKIFRLEEGLAGVPAWLAARLGDPAGEPSLPHSQKAPSGPARKVVPSRPDLRRIRAFYAQDYTRFSYPDPDFAAAPADPLAGLRTGFAALAAPGLARAYLGDRV